MIRSRPHYPPEPSLTDLKSVRRSTLTGMAAILMWSASLGLFRSIAEIFGATGGAALIFSCSGVIASLALGWPRLRALPPLYLFGCGALFVSYEIALALSIGLAHDRQQALELGMINYLWPSLTVLLAIASGAQRTSWLLGPAVALCFGGIAWVVVGDGDMSLPQLLTHVASNPIAYGLALAAAFIWAGYSVLTRRVGQGANGVPVFLLATAAVLWIKYALGDAPALAFNWPGAAQILLLGVLTAAAYSCWNHGVQHGNLTVLATASYFTPVLSAALTSAWLGVRPGADFAVGVAMVTGGSLLCMVAVRKG